MLLLWHANFKPGGLDIKLLSDFSGSVFYSLMMYSKTCLIRLILTLSSPPSYLLTSPILSYHPVLSTVLSYLITLSSPPSYLIFNPAYSIFFTFFILSTFLSYPIYLPILSYPPSYPILSSFLYYPILLPNLSYPPS